MRYSLSSKIMLTLFIFIAVLSAVLFFTLRLELTGELENMIKDIQNTHISGHVIANTNPEAWLFPYSEQSQEMFDHTISDLSLLPDILRIKIWNTNNEVIASDAKALVGQRFPDNEEIQEVIEDNEVVFERGDFRQSSVELEHKYDSDFGELFELYMPIKFSGQDKVIGVIEIYQSTDIFYKFFDRIIWAFGLIMSFSATILFFLSFFIFYFFINRPLRLLTEASQKISDKNFDFKIKPLSKDELGNLTENFDFMRGTIKTMFETERVQQEKIKQINTDLEKKQADLLIAFKETDIERKKYKREKSKIETVLTNLDDALVLTDEKGFVVSVNPRFEKIFDISALEITNKPFEKFLSVVLKVFGQSGIDGINQELSDYFLKAKISYAILDRELIMNRPLVEYGATATLVKPVFSVFTTPAWSLEKTIMGRIWIFSDISVQKEIERLHTEFVSITSHQMKTPLTGIKAFVEILLAGDVGEFNVRQKDFLNEIYQSNERMIELIDSLLSISRIESGRIVFEPKTVNFISLADDVVRETMILFKNKKQDLQFIKPQELPFVTIDAKLLFQALSNVLANASKYTPENGKIVFEISQQNGNILAKISDTGAGIPASQQDQVFSKFFRGENVALNTEGTGLGLYIVKQFIIKNGGKIWFESEENKGTIFYVTIPVKNHSVII